MKIIDKWCDRAVGFLFIIWWCAGIAYAKGLLAILAVLFPPYAMYLVVENLMKSVGLV